MHTIERCLKRGDQYEATLNREEIELLVDSVHVASVEVASEYDKP